MGVRSEADRLRDELGKREQELACLYRAEEILSRRRRPIEEMLLALAAAIPGGWRHSDVCHCRISLEGKSYESPGFRAGPWGLSAPLDVDGYPVGEISVYYTEERPGDPDGPFVEGERRLLGSLAKLTGLRLSHRARAERIKEDTHFADVASSQAREWRVILDFLRRTDHALLLRMTRKMINYLCWHGVPGAPELLREFAPDPTGASGQDTENRPSARQRHVEVESLVKRTFDVAEEYLSEAEILKRIQQWIQEDKSADLAGALERLDSSLADITEALDRFRRTGVDESTLSASSQTQLRVALLRRFFSERTEFIHAARDAVRVGDFCDIAPRIIATPRSRGKLGGKSSGLFVAMQLARHATDDLFADVRVPRTWYVASDAQLDFIRYNNLEDLYDRKYQDIDQIRQDYPHVIQLFKNSHFPPDVIRGLSLALDDLGQRPLIVRSSSLLEDGTEAAFSGKYKSLFLANRGSKRVRLEALQDAIAEVYASIFSPDPIQYRAERDLLDVHEEMGIMIQEVVGKQVGRYFLPAFAGVAFSNNDFRWSPRIRRSDGLIRLVPGLGTRAVDRLGDDYPVLLAPGQPGIRANITAEEIVRYAPSKVDAIDLETGTFETADFEALLRTCGREYPEVRRLVSRFEDGRLVRPLGLGSNFETGAWIVTFDGLVAETPFVAQIRGLLQLLEKKLGGPVDIEFAHDGEHLYLLQCRPQSYSLSPQPAPIPRTLRREETLFTANRHVSNGSATNVTHVVYVDPEEYAGLPDHETFLRVGRAVGRLNAMLPKRQFILLGPGRWGSRGDVRLGVSVTYSDINNTALLAEIARRREGYMPDLSFGTHFFQDLVEAGIRYLPLYPDEPGNVLDERFLTGSRSVLTELLPEFADLEHVVKVIDVPATLGGKTLSVLMNGDLDKAVAVFVAAPGVRGGNGHAADSHHHASSWREYMAQRLAAEIDRDRWPVRQVYLAGNTKSGTAEADSDIDLIVHFEGDEEQRRELEHWLDGWSRSLDEANYLRTGQRRGGLLDIAWVTDEDVRLRRGAAEGIGAAADPARPLLPDAEAGP